MPSGIRYTATVKDTLYNLSAKQWAYLRKESVKVSDEWKVVQTTKGLVSRKLFVKRNGTLVRTKLGDQVLAEIAAKSRKPKPSKLKKEKA